MKCPRCKHPQLVPTTQPNTPLRFECEFCRGQWMQALHYWRWLNESSADSSPQPSPQVCAIAKDKTKAMLCPECGRMLRRFMVGTSQDFHLDHCTQCDATWLDVGEWDRLCAMGLQRQSGIL